MTLCHVWYILPFVHRADIDEMDAHLNRLGASLFFHPHTVADAAANGIDNVFVMYAGRAGLLGDVDAQQASSALGFFAPTVVRDVWTGVAAAGGPVHVGTVFATAMAATATASWAAEPAATVAAVGSEVLAAVEPFGMALYSAWRGRALATGHVADVVHALRELRGDVHIQCVATAGLQPLQAEMATRGAAAAQLHGWQPPYPDPAEFIEAVALAEAHTSERMAATYARTLGHDRTAALAAAVQELAKEL